jgi:hypothetical protein
VISLFAWGLGGMSGTAPELLSTLINTPAATHGGAISGLFLLMVLLFAGGVMQRQSAPVTPATLFLGGMVMALAIAAG